MKKTILLILIISTIFSSKAQTKHSFLVGTGLTFQNTKETRFTSNFRNGIGLNVGLGYEKTKNNNIQRLKMSFIKANQGKGNVSSTLNLRPEMRYEYLKTTNKNAALGGYIDLGSILGFRRGSWANENAISYNIWTSVGLAADFHTPLSIGSKKGTWETQLRLPLLTYSIRPSYTFPYTDNYLENDVFLFNQAGLAKKIITGGKLVLPHKFTNIHFQTRILLPYKQTKTSFGMQYAFNLLRTNEVKPIFQTNHSLSLIIKRTK